MTLKKLWLVFAQAATIAVAALFVVTTLKPEWLATREGTAPIVVSQAPSPVEHVTKAGSSSYSAAVDKAAPAVVNIFTSGAVKSPRHPFMDDRSSAVSSVTRSTSHGALRAWGRV